MFLDNIKNKLNQNELNFIGEETAMRAAVLIPLVQVNHEWHILFEVRALTMRQQPGDISFPGGKIDPTDATTLDTAVRETCEELGIHKSTINPIGQLSPFIPSQSFVVYPYVAEVDYDFEQEHNEEEVEEVFTVPVDWLLNYQPYHHVVSFEPKPPSDFPYDKIANGYQYQWRPRQIDEWFYEYKHYTIWGLTARILKHFISTISKNDNE